MRAVVLFLLFACACVAAPASAVCGDGKVSGRETCDVAGATDPACIDCKVTLGYECRNPYGSASTCNIKHGDGIVTVSTDAKYASQSEECDDGNAMNRDGCTAEGLLEAGYYCDLLLTADPANPKVACGQEGTATKPHPFCGDGITAWPETCDLGGGVAQWAYTTDGATKGNWGCWQCNLVKGWTCDGSLSNGLVTAPNTPCSSRAGTGRSWDQVPGGPCCGRYCGDGIVAGGERCDDGTIPLGTWQNDIDECPGCRYPSEDTIHNYNIGNWGVRDPVTINIVNRITTGSFRGTGSSAAADPYWACTDERSVYLSTPTLTSRYDNLAYVTANPTRDCSCQSHTASPVGECVLSATQYQNFRVCTDLANEYFCGSCGNHCNTPTYSIGCEGRCCSMTCSCGGSPDPYNCCCWGNGSNCNPRFAYCTGSSCVYENSCTSNAQVCGAYRTCT